MIEGFADRHIRWPIRFALAQTAIGRPVPPHLLMCVQMIRNGEGCTSATPGTLGT